MGKIKLAKILPFIGLVLFVVIVQRIGVYKLFGVLKEINIYYFIFVFILSGAIIIIKAMKWKLIIESREIKYSLMNCISAWLVGNSASLITPGRVGDLYRAFYLKKFGNDSIGGSSATVVFDRFIDIVIMIILAIFGLLMLSKTFGVLFNFLLPVSVLFLIVLIIIFTRVNTIENILKYLFNKLIPERLRSNQEINLHDFFEGTHTIIAKKRYIFWATILSIVAWFINIFQFYLLTLALNIHVPFLFVAYITPIITIVELFPVSISGIGTRDAALIFLLFPFLVKAEVAIFLSLSMLFVNFSIGFVGLLIWFREQKLMIYTENVS